MRMNRRTSRNEKHKYFNDEKMALGENENIFELLKNLWLNNLQFIILKCSRFCLFITFVLFCFYYIHKCS